MSEKLRECPFCKQELQVEPEKGEIVRCVNTDCPAILEEYDIKLFDKPFAPIDALRIISDRNHDIIRAMMVTEDALRVRAEDAEVRITYLSSLNVCMESEIEFRDEELNRLQKRVGELEGRIARIYQEAGNMNNIAPYAKEGVYCLECGQQVRVGDNGYECTNCKAIALTPPATEREADNE